MAQYTRGNLEQHTRLELRRICRDLGLGAAEYSQMRFDDMIEWILDNQDDPMVPNHHKAMAIMHRDTVANMEPKELADQLEIFAALRKADQHRVAEVIHPMPGKDVSWGIKFLKLKQRLRMMSNSFSLVCKDGELYMWIKSKKDMDLDHYAVLADVIFQEAENYLESPPEVVGGVMISYGMRTILDAATDEWQWIQDLCMKAEIAPGFGYSHAKKLTSIGKLERQMQGRRACYRKPQESKQ
jgi:hypothetical protein